MDSCEPAMSHEPFPDDAWRTASFCGPNGGNCVAVNLGTRGRVGVRDTKAATGPALVFDGPGWGAFLSTTGFGWPDQR
jgi:hypothetical protein